MSSLFAGPSPRWFTIPADRPFLDDLALGVIQTFGEAPAELAGATILVPTRRAARSLAHAFLQASPGRALLLPQIRVMGDLDEGEPPFEAGDQALDLPPAISPWRRRFELAGLVAAHPPGGTSDLSAGAAMAFADALGSFFDSCQMEEVDPADRLDDLVEGDLAEHWRRSADFLKTALREWPRRLEALGVMDVTARRVSLLRALADGWRERPPQGPIIAAGSTGSTKASADLLIAIAEAPLGCVALPGLDLNLADDAWREVGDAHPQGAMKRLIGRAGVGREAVSEWPASPLSASGRWRRRLVAEALRPPERTADWLAQIADIEREAGGSGLDPILEGLKGLSRVTARTEEEAGTLCALLLREALETPGKTCALVTPDADLARRVSARLRRFAITADSSAGAPLAGASVGVLASRVARLSVDPLDPVALLAVLKHPLVRLGRSPEALERERRRLETSALRGARPINALALSRRLESHAEAADLLQALRSALRFAADPFESGEAVVAQAARALAQTLEALAADASRATGELWGGQGGERLAALLQSLMEESDALPPASPAGFADLLDSLMAEETLRGGGATHPRLQILGVLEARLVRADRLILAGLEEGSWPRPPPLDPFVSRPMRERLGLGSPERRIGLSAHDFAQAACGPEVILLDTQRRNSAPAVQSRWLWRLETLIAGAGKGRAIVRRDDALAWAEALDAPLQTPPLSLLPATRPRPAPPVEVRPRKLGVTQVETWVRDPYALYARRILRLEPMERPDEPVEARARGQAIHTAFERFTRGYPGDLPRRAEAAFEDLIVDALHEKGMPKSRMAREHALARNVAAWAVEFERRRRAGAKIEVELSGAMTFAAPFAPFTVTARADRVEDRGATADILDFKTGAAPTPKVVDAGFAPQLTLTAAIVAAGGFETIGAREPGELVYVRVTGRKPAGEECLAAKDPQAAMEKAVAGLKRKVARFDDPSTPYTARTAPQFVGSHGDYDHLARLWEWHVIGAAEGEGE